VQEFSVSGEELIAKFKELVHEGNIRRVTIKNDEGRTLIEIPLTLGVVGAALLPVFAAIGAVAALATRCTIVVERTDDAPANGGRSESEPAAGAKSESEPAGDITERPV
jgi:hypothetical protein